MCIRDRDETVNKSGDVIILIADTSAKIKMNSPLVRAFALDDLVHRRPVTALGGERRCDPEPFAHGPAVGGVRSALIGL